MVEIALRWVDALVPKKRTIIFFAGDGKYYGDNPRYLYEYMRDNTNERLIWWFRDRATVKWANEHGVPAVLGPSMKGLWTALRSGVWVTDHGPPLPSWAEKKRIVVQLWHGVGPKQVPGKTESAAVAERLRTYFSKYDLVTVPSREVAPEWGTSITVKQGALVYDGYPRHDAILRCDRNDARQRLRKLLGNEQLPKWVILYAPTWREQGGEVEPQWDQLESLLIEKDAMVLIRSHPLYSRWRSNYSSNRILQFNSDVAPDIYEYLSGIDLLITDYSSLSIDYLVLRRPIIFYMPDFDKYNRVRGIHWSLPDEFPGDVALTEDEFGRLLKYVLTHGKLTEAGRRRQNSLFRRYFEREPGRASERLAARIRKMMDQAWPDPNGVHIMRRH